MFEVCFSPQLNAVNPGMNAALPVINAGMQHMAYQPFAMACQKSVVLINYKPYITIPTTGRNNNKHVPCHSTQPMHLRMQ